MNKKFLSVALFGALLVTSAGTFTSCKDYDDDIDAVNGRIDGLVKSLSDLQAQVGGFVKSVDYNESTGVLTVVGADGKSHTYTVGKALPSYTLEVTADGKVILKKDGTTVSSGDIKFPTTPTPAPAFDPSKLTIVDGVVMYDGKATGVTIPKSTSGTMVAIKDGDVTVGYTIEMSGEKADFYVVDAMPLKGLVIKPECYVGGIPSVQANNVEYTNWIKGAYATVTKNGETYTLATTGKSYITPQIWAYYHMNPASVTKNQIAAMSFISDDKEYYPVSRASQMAPTVNFDKSTVEAVGNQSYLKVAMDAKAENIAGTGKVSVYALQVTTKKVGKNDAKVITSDYGSIHKTIITDLTLKNKVGAVDVVMYGQSVARAGGVNALVGQAKEAIDAVKDYVVATNEELDLTKVISAYGSYDGATSVKITNVKDLGLKYVYTASNYISGDNETPQNTFFNGDKASKGIVKPEYKTDAEAANTVGREPLIRVELVDTTKATPLVVAVGWVKTKIEKGVTKGFDKTFDQGTYNYGCVGFTPLLTVENMNDVYHEAGMSYEDFHKAYTLDAEADGITAILPVGSVGKVELVTDQATGTQTKLLKWTVTPAQALTQSAISTAMTAVATFKSVDGTRGDITITFKGTIALPSGVIGDAQKITQYWDPNKKFLKLDVKEPVATAASEFVAQMYSFFEGNKITVDGVNTAFTSFAAANLKSKFVFAITDATKTVKVGSDTYTLSVKTNGNNSELWAAKGTAAAELVATINGDMTAATNGVLTYNIVGTNAKVLLNKSAYNVAPFTAAVKIVVTNDCDEVLPLTNDVFDVKFLRPINANDKETATLQDATTAGAKIDMSQLMSLTDWRGKDFALTPADFYNYYGVTGITIDKAKIMTNMNQTGDTKKLLSEVTTKIDINYTYALNKSATPVTYGDLSYYNNSGTVTSSFKLYIPVTVKYTFGEVTANVTLTITPTH